MSALDVIAGVADAMLRAGRAGPARLSLEQRWSIVVLHRDGRSNSYIARKVPCNRDTVRDVLARYAATGSPGSGSRSGRPRETDEALDTAIAVTAHIDKFTTPRQIVRKLDLDISPRTADRRLQEAGLFGRVARRKRVFSDAEKRKRLTFAEGYRAWTAADWEHVLFSDEKIFWGKGFHGQIWVRRPIGEALNPDYVAHTVPHPVKTNAWGCFCARGQGYLHLFTDTMDAALQKRILSDNLLPSARLHYTSDPPEPWWFLHDNDKKFRSRLVQDFIHNAGVSLIDFPPYSPDLNPIENLWAVMERAVEKHAAETVDALQDVVADEWKKIDADLLRKLVHSMPARIEAVIAAEGNHTGY